MSQIVLTIGARNYPMACAAGEEDHIAELGRMLQDKLKTLPGGTSQNDSRSLLFAALLLADELYDLRNAATAQTQTDPAADVGIPPDRLDALADRLEALASALENPTETSSGA